jgi:soluble lytic murein transglycosylase-like protein
MCAEIAAVIIAGYILSFYRQALQHEFNREATKWQAVDKVPYAAMINQASEVSGVSPLVVAAVIKAESSFQPRALSPAGAYGLMQVIPGTWQYVNKRLKICDGRHAGDCTPICFYNPELNIRIGTAYLGELYQRYPGNLAWAIAAYNAGPHAVDQYRGIPPYAETTGYVQRVIENWYLLQQRPLPAYDLTVTRLIAVYRGLLYLLWSTVSLSAWLMYRNHKTYRSWRWR